MKQKLKVILTICGICVCVVVAPNIEKVYAKEPIMQEKYVVEEQKVKRARFIWNSCIRELENERLFTNKDVKNINKYLDKQMKGEKFESPTKKYDRQKDILKMSAVNKLVKENIITDKQGQALTEKLSKYNLSNLDR